MQNLSDDQLYEIYLEAIDDCAFGDFFCSDRSDRGTFDYAETIVFERSIRFSTYEHNIHHQFNYVNGKVVYDSARIDGQTLDLLAYRAKAEKPKTFTVPYIQDQYPTTIIDRDIRQRPMSDEWIYNAYLRVKDIIMDYRKHRYERPDGVSVVKWTARYYDEPYNVEYEIVNKRGTKVEQEGISVVFDTVEVCLIISPEVFPRRRFRLDLLKYKPPQQPAVDVSEPSDQQGREVYKSPIRLDEMSDDEAYEIYFKARRHVRSWHVQNENCESDVWINSWKLPYRTKDGREGDIVYRQTITPNERDFEVAFERVLVFGYELDLMEYRQTPGYKEKLAALKAQFPESLDPFPEEFHRWWTEIRENTRSVEQISSDRSLSCDEIELQVDEVDDIDEHGDTPDLNSLLVRVEKLEAEVQKSRRREEALRDAVITMREMLNRRAH
ncbi:MAG: hypothetical protein N5P05_004223 (plasmid) [Chroococcopsis gigantea SAG 12.99]|jgi:hypothetical protein|nr:hypothetical protein [Chroococcopsis gigantea SAG 12.99]